MQFSVKKGTLIFIVDVKCRRHLDSKQLFSVLFEPRFVAGIAPIMAHLMQKLQRKLSKGKSGPYTIEKEEQ